MRQTKPLPPLSGYPSAGLCRLSPVPAGKWPFPAHSPQTFVWVLGPLPRSAPSEPLPVSSRSASASPQGQRVRHARYPPQCNFNGGRSFAAAVIPSCSGSHTRWARRLHPPMRLVPGRPGRLRHAMNRRLPGLNRGIATCLNRAIGTAGLSPAGLRPCRPLPLHEHLVQGLSPC